MWKRTYLVLISLLWWLHLPVYCLFWYVFTLQTTMYVYHQRTFAFGLLTWILHLGFLFWFFFAKNNSVITKEQWFVACEYDGICFVVFKVFLGFVDNSECCNMQQSIVWLCCRLMNMVVIGFFFVLQITNSVTKPMMISSTWNVDWIYFLAFFLCYFLLLCRQ